MKVPSFAITVVLAAIIGYSEGGNAQLPPTETRLDQQRIVDLVTKELNGATDNMIQKRKSFHVEAAASMLQPSSGMAGPGQMGRQQGPSEMGRQQGPSEMGRQQGPNEMGRPPGSMGFYRGPGQRTWRKRRDMGGEFKRHRRSNKALRNHRVHRRVQNDFEQDYINGWRT